MALKKSFYVPLRNQTQKSKKINLLQKSVLKYLRNLNNPAFDRRNIQFLKQKSAPEIGTRNQKMSYKKSFYGPLRNQTQKSKNKKSFVEIVFEFLRNLNNPAINREIEVRNPRQKSKQEIQK